MWRRGWARSEGQDESKRLSRGKKKKKNSGEEREWGEENVKCEKKGTGSPSDVIAQLCPYFRWFGYSNFLYCISNSHVSFNNKKRTSTKNKIE
jgi:hypothetical protein